MKHSGKIEKVGNDTIVSILLPVETFIENKVEIVSFEYKVCGTTINKRIISSIKLTLLKKISPRNAISNNIMFLFIFK